MRINSEIVPFFNKRGFDILLKYVNDNGVAIITYDGSSEKDVEPDWFGVFQIDGKGILYVYKYFSTQNTIRGIKIGDWKYYLIQEKNVKKGMYYMNLRFEVGKVEEENYS